MKFAKKVCIAVVFLSAALLVSPGYAQEGENDELYEPMYNVESEPDTELLPVMETIQEYGSLTTFYDLLVTSGLAEKLEGDGPFTVFAPDDAAFEQLTPEKKEQLKNDPVYLKAVLARHIIADRKLQFGSTPESMTITGMNGDMLAVEIDEETVKVDKAWVIDEWLECGNGVIHVIDEVLLPPKKKPAKK